MFKIVGKVQKGRGVGIKKRIQNSICRLFCGRGGVSLRYQFFPNIKKLVYIILGKEVRDFFHNLGHFLLAPLDFVLLFSQLQPFLQCTSIYKRTIEILWILCVSFLQTFSDDSQEVVHFSVTRVYWWKFLIQVFSIYNKGRIKKKIDFPSLCWPFPLQKMENEKWHRSHKINAVWYGSSNRYQLALTYPGNFRWNPVLIPPTL